MTGLPLDRGDGGGRYPGFSTLAQARHWDRATAAVVGSRMGLPPDIRFFTPSEEAAARALFDLLLDQHGEQRVPVVNMVDARLAEEETDGWHYDNMPEDGEAWRASLAALDREALSRGDCTFALLDPESRPGCCRTSVTWTGPLARPTGGPRVEPVDQVRVYRLLLPSPCVGRDRLRRPGLPARLQEPGSGPAGTLRSPGCPSRRRSYPWGRPVSGLRERNESAWLLPAGPGSNTQLRRDMRRYDERDEVDIVIVGCGAGGATLLQRLARAGWRAVALDAGPFWDPEKDWVSDEAGSHHLYWTEPRVIAGADPVPLGSNNSGRGVGGSMVHFAGYTPRFHPSDFHTFSADGVGADWPLEYLDLRPFYEDIEAELPVSGEDWPWGDPHRYPHRPHPVSGNGELFLRGARACGITAKVGPVAITNGRFGNRPHCIYRGFCLQGCKVNAKASPLITHVPDALAHGAEIRPDSMATTDWTRRTHGAGDRRRVRPPWHERFQRARLVAVAGYSIETPRLLLNSASARFPEGMCNDFDQVGRYLMVQGAPQTAGRFQAEVRMWKAPPPECQHRGLLRNRSRQTL